MAAELFGAAYAQDPRTEEEFAEAWNAAVADIARTHPNARMETIAYAASVAMGRFQCACRVRFLQEAAGFTRAAPVKPRKWP